MTGCRSDCAATTLALMYANCWSRSGCFEPSSALRLDWREKPSFTNSLRTVSALMGWPIAVNAAASLSMLLDTQIRGRMGSPSVAGSTRRLSSGTSSGSFSATALRPPPARRTCPLGSGAASRSSSPRLIVERASPVILETTASPPHPAVRPALDADKPGLDALRSDLAAHVDRLHVQTCDVTSAESVTSAFSGIGRRFGRLNGLVCSAGVLRIGTLDSMAIEDFDQLFAVNVRG